MPPGGIREPPRGCEQGGHHQSCWAEKPQRLHTGREWRPGGRGTGCRDDGTDLREKVPWKRPVPTPDLGSKLTSFHGLSGVRRRNCTSAPSWRAGVSHCRCSCPAKRDTWMSSGGGSYLTGSRGGGRGEEADICVSCWSPTFQKICPHLAQPRVANQVPQTRIRDTLAA